jgi:DNA-binding MarR family transcriptional regulator
VKKENSGTSHPRGEAAESDALYGLPGHLIRRCHQISVALFHEECGAHNITPPQYGVLRMLAGHDGVDQITMAGMVALNRTTAGEVVSRLEAAKLLERRDCSEDRRMKRLYITKAGRQLVRDIGARVRRVQERLLEPLNKAERGLFIEFLARIASVNNELSRAPLRPARQATERRAASSSRH